MPINMVATNAEVEAAAAVADVEADVMGNKRKKTKEVCFVFFVKPFASLSLY